MSSSPINSNVSEEFDTTSDLEEVTSNNRSYSSNQLSFRFFEGKLNELNTLRSRNKSYKSKSKMSSSSDHSNSSVKFPTFSGITASSQEARSFLSKFISACKLKGYTTDVKVCLQFGLCLETGSGAESWYQGELAKLELDDSLTESEKPSKSTSSSSTATASSNDTPILTIANSWKLLKEAFTIRYIGASDNHSQYMLELQNCKLLPSETVQEHAERWQSIASKIHPPIADRELATMYVLSLGELKNEVMRSKSKTLQEAINSAKTEETLIDIHEMELSQTGGKPNRAVRSKINAVNPMNDGPNDLDSKLNAMEQRLTKSFTELIGKSTKELKDYCNRTFVRKSRDGGDKWKLDAICRNCGLKGHIRPDCKKPRSNDRKPTAGGINSATMIEEEDVDDYPSDHESDYDEDQNYIERANCNPVTAVINSTNAFGTLLGVPTPLHTEATIKGLDTTIAAVVDTGAVKTLISTRVTDKLSQSNYNKAFKPLSTEDFELKSASGNKLTVIGKLIISVHLNKVNIGDMEAYVVNNLDNDLLIGIDVLQGNNFGPLDVAEKTIVYYPNGRANKANNTIIQFKPYIHYSKRKEADILVGSIYLTSKQKIPANSEFITQDTKIKGLSNFNNKYVSEWKKLSVYKDPLLLVEPSNKLKPKLSILSSVALGDNDTLSGKRGIPIRIRNYTNQDIVLDTSTRLGRVDSMEPHYVYDEQGQEKADNYTESINGKDKPPISNTSTRSALDNDRKHNHSY